MRQHSAAHATDARRSVIATARHELAAVTAVLRGWPAVIVAQLCLGVLFIASTVSSVQSLLRPASREPLLGPTRLQGVHLFATQTAWQLTQCAFAVAAVMYLLWSGKASAVSLGLREATGRRRATSVLALAAVPAYIGVIFFSAYWTASVGRFLGAPSSRPVFSSGAAEGWRIATEIVIAVRAGVTEELQLLAIPIAILAATRHRTGPWFPLIALAVIEAVRVGIHLYYGWGALFVLPWMAGTLLLYRAVGLIWPFIVGHAVYDALAFTGNMGLRAPHQALASIAQVGLVLAVALLIAGVLRRPSTSTSRLSPALRN